MKVIRLCAGLGNVMLQYCVYLQLKKRYPNEKIYVDTSFFKLTDYPFDFHKVLNKSIKEYDINELFINDPEYRKKLDSFRFWKQLGFNTYSEMVRGKDEKLYCALDCKISLIELPLLYREKFPNLKIVSFSYSLMKDVIREFLTNKDYLNPPEPKFITIKHFIVEFINSCLKGEAKLKYNLLRNPNIRKRFINQILHFKRPDYCIYGKTNLSSSGDIYYNVFGDPGDIEGVKDEVRATFTFSPFDDDLNIEMANRIKEKESVALHARVVNFEYGMKKVLERDYYKKAVHYIEKQVKKPLSFFIFSDNVEWCKRNLDLLGLKNKNITFVDFNKGENSFRDMQLMSLCKHIIIPNSTFSWWGGVVK